MSRYYKILLLVIGLISSLNSFSQTCNDNPADTSNPQVLCVGAIEPYQVDIDENGGAGTTGSIYSWQILTPGFLGNIILCSTSNKIVINWGATPPGDYILQVVETTSGCPGEPVELTIRLTPLLKPTFSSVGPYCYGTTIPPLPTTSANGVTGTWSPALSNTQSQKYIFLPDSGQCADSASMTILINSKPSISGNQEICVFTTTQLTSTNTPAASNPWVSSNTGVATISNTGLISGVSAGTTQITYTDENGCQDTVTVLVNPLPTITGDLILCNEDSSQLIGSGTPAADNPWVSSNPGVASVDANGMVTANAAGTTDITYTDINGCAKTVTITINPLPEVVVSDQSICRGDSTVLTATTSGGTPGYTYNWTPSTGLSGTTGSTVNASPASTTEYTVTATDSNGCSDTAKATITVKPKPTTSPIYHR